MARSTMGLPAGVEVRGGTVRIRFVWNGKRRYETLTLPATKAGIAAASRLRDQVKDYIRHGLLDEKRYAELFPGSATAPDQGQTFGAYAQLWLDSRSIAAGTRKNYVSILNTYWMRHLAITPVAAITPTLLRRVVADIQWTSDGVKRNALTKLNTILDSAVGDGLLPKNPAEKIELPKRTKKEINPFRQDEADRIIAALYEQEHWPSRIYAAFFEFCFYTGVRLSEGLALRWDAVDLGKRTAHICRTVALGVVEERTKTGADRVVLLNDRALHALEYALKYAERRAAGSGRLKEFPYCFPPSKNSEHVQQTSDVHHQWRPTLKALGIRYRPPYNCRHTYATMCLMAGMTPAFIAKQLGHSVQMLLSTYAHWISGESDWAELAKLQNGPKVAQD
ncbi:Integrase [Pseudomonas sp. OF001]|uniref:site-specific integrase n=1 Tax=Pseudomonas sp. OF001 TaxID=2772300 RepID=UPI00191B2971|nr:site-specific integrase [Pseudomonas sp. OF001]CAD5376774.1 Integrase [Pseudomonas sp. OF001]